MDNWKPDNPESWRESKPEWGPGSGSEASGKTESELSEILKHPTAERLESFVEGLLDAGDRVVVESHLLSCDRCQNEVEELRSLFAALSRLERFSPSFGFANRVMLQVRIPEPWYAKAGKFLQPVVPKSTRGWAFASAFLSLPLLAMGAVTLWLMSKPFVSSEGLIAFTTKQLWETVSAAASSFGSALVQSDVMLVFFRAVRNLLEAGATGAGLLGLTFAAVSAWSTWVLYQNLFRNSRRETDYVTYSF